MCIRDSILYIAYPEGNDGYDLISCLRCGHIYSASVAKQVYSGSDLMRKLEGIQCANCGGELSETAAPYPEKYLSLDGVKEYQRPAEIPPERTSTKMEFDEIYSD